jgi:hypothetical protein
VLFVHTFSRVGLPATVRIKRRRLGPLLEQRSAATATQSPMAGMRPLQVAGQSVPVLTDGTPTTLIKACGKQGFRGKACPFGRSTAIALDRCLRARIHHTFASKSPAMAWQEGQDDCLWYHADALPALPLGQHPLSSTHTTCAIPSRT